MWFLALTLATAAGLPPATEAQTSSPAPAGAPAPPGADDAFAYRVVIVAPDEVVAPVRSAVDLVRWQDFADMTEDLFDRLARDALAQARGAASPQGFFSA